MAKIIVLPGHNVRALAAHAGSAVKGQIGFRPSNSELEVADVTQAALDAALITYAADQANIDTAFQATEDATTVGELQQQFGDDRIIQAVTEVMRTELNVLRASIPLPDISAGQMDGKVRAKIANP